MILHFIGWIIAGMIAGFIASKLVNKTGEGLVRDLLLGVVGGFVGGWLVDFFFPKYHVEGGLNIPSILVAIVGGVILLVIYHAIRRRV